MIKQHLNKHNIHSIEQFTNYHNTEILQWKQFHHNIQKISRGRTLKWFTYINTLIQEKTNPTLDLIDPNPYTWQPLKGIMTKNWITTNKYIMRKVLSMTQHNTSFWHYKLNQHTNKLTRCKGCKYSDSGNAKNCIITRQKKSLYKIIVDSKKFWHGRKAESPIPQPPPTNNYIIPIPPKHYSTHRIAKSFNTLQKEIMKEYNELTFGVTGNIQVVLHINLSVNPHLSTISINKNNHTWSVTIRNQT